MFNIKATEGIPCKGSGRNLWTMGLFDSPNCASWAWDAAIKLNRT